MTNFPWLTVLIAVPLVGALVVGFLPQRSAPDGPEGRPASRSALPQLVALGVELAFGVFGDFVLFVKGT